MKRTFTGRLAILIVCSWLASGCSSLPPLESRIPSTVITNTAGTRLAAAISPLANAHPERSGIYPLPDARNAFAARVQLARAAESSLDAQYYIWRNDMTGTLLFDALREAADRGVRVRLLLDDNNTSELDPVLAALDAHPNIEVRLFNPFPYRSVRWLGYLTDFARLNRRMHNKSFTADNQATIIGGRNIGNEYFGATDDVLFADLDVMAIGPVVDAVSNSFDRYWASASSYPVQGLLAPVDDEQLSNLRAAASAVGKDPAAQAYLRAIRESSFVRELQSGRLAFEWAATQMISDDPAKGLGKSKPEEELPDMLKQALGAPARELDLVSPYFVPTASGVAAFTAMARRGVKIRVLTNSLEATDVPAVHAGYAKRREALLAAGITLYELKRQANAPAPPDRMRLAGSSSGTSLHAKTFSVDGSRVFVGSFNFDPRSARLNTEMGFVMESPALARRIKEAIDLRVPFNAYEARLSENGGLYWLERRDGAVVRLETEPGTSLALRVGVFFLSLLPIEWLL